LTTILELKPGSEVSDPTADTERGKKCDRPAWGEANWRPNSMWTSSEKGVGMVEERAGGVSHAERGEGGRGRRSRDCFYAKRRR